MNAPYYLIMNIKHDPKIGAVKATQAAANNKHRVFLESEYQMDMYYSFMCIPIIMLV